MINAVRRVKLRRFVCTVLFSFIACAAFGDVVWPTAQIGTDGNLASSGQDGWRTAIPLKDTVWFYSGGTYTPWLDGETLYLNTNGTIYCRNVASKGETHLTIDVRNGANLIVDKFYMGDTSDPVTDDMSMALKVRDGSSFYAKSTAGLRSGNSNRNHRRRPHGSPQKK